MFLGTYEPKLDDKGRVILPARFREDMEGGIVLTRGQEHCIYAFPAQEFEQMTVPDKQGRITLPPDLRKYAGLDRELTVIGAGSRAEIWNSQAWNDYLSVQEDVFSQTENEIIPGMF